jgi:hypothetical protein
MVELHKDEKPLNNIKLKDSEQREIPNKEVNNSQRIEKYMNMRHKMKQKSIKNVKEKVRLLKIVQ